MILCERPPLDDTRRETCDLPADRELLVAHEPYHLTVCQDHADQLFFTEDWIRCA